MLKLGNMLLEHQKYFLSVWIYASKKCWVKTMLIVLIQLNVVELKQCDLFIWNQK